VQLVSSQEQGFTLIELMITVAIMGILLALGIPYFQDWIHNNQIRTAAESILSGMQSARGEAVKRNGWVQFVLTSPAAAGSASGWQIVWVTPPPGGCPPMAVDPVTGVAVADPVLKTRSGDEGSATSSINIFPAGTTAITFDPLGRVGTDTDCGASMRQINVASAVINDTSVRPLEIRITSSGGIRLCAPWAGDPNDLNPPANVSGWSLPAGDPRRCN
jgi:type IV fimbrial biogenesis protein FimT